MKAGLKGFVAVRILFVAYCGVMLWLLFGQRMEGSLPQISWAGDKSHMNLVPFDTIRLYVKLLRSNVSTELVRHATINLVGNVLLFVPLGWFLPRIFRKYRWFIRFVIRGGLLICLVEAAQYVTGLGICDVDDLILNGAGMLLGYGFWRLTRKK